MKTKNDSDEKSPSDAGDALPAVSPPKRAPLMPERSDFLEGDAPAAAKVESFLAGR